MKLLNLNFYHLFDDLMKFENKKEHLIIRKNGWELKIILFEKIIKRKEILSRISLY
jgi:hypothetical protein